MALILVVDDEPDACLLMQRILAAGGHDVHGFTEAPAAMRWLKQHRPDLAILDIKLQVGDGISLLQTIRHGQPRLKVILVTGYPSVETADRACELGVSAYLVKPLELDELEQRVARALALE